MKKSLIYILAISAVFASCTKEIPTAENGPMYFTTEIQQYGGNESKADFSNLTINFAVGDAVRVSSPDAVTKKGSKYQADGTLKIDSGMPECDNYYAIFPYNPTPAEGNTEVTVANFSVVTGSEMKMEGIIFPIQQAVLNGVDMATTPMFGKSGSDRKFKFVQASSLLKFDLQMDGVTKVVLSSNATDVLISGKFNITVNDTSGDGWFDQFTIGTSSTGAQNYITLIPPVGQTTFPRGVYYITTRPERNCKEGLTLTFYGSGDEVLKSATNSAKVQLKRGTVRYLGNFTTGQE